MVFTMDAKTFMKKLLLSIAAVIALFACKRENLDPDYPFTIIVETYNDSIPVNNVRVEVSTPVVDNVVEMVGYTDEKGRVSFEYDLEAVLLVRAIRGNNPIRYMGCADIRLEPDKNVTKHVYLEEFDPSVPGCQYSP